MQPPLAPIIDRCLQHDRAAQKLLFQQYKDTVMSACYRYATDINEAKDMAQNTFIRVFHHLVDYDADKGSFVTWISRIAVREAIAIKRKNKRLIFPDSQMPLTDEVLPPQIIDQLSIAELKNLIEKMPESHKIILNLYYFDEFSHQEIAELLGIETSSSRSKLTRAKAELQTQWKLASQTGL